MQNNPEGGDLEPADDVHSRCKKNSSVLSYIKRGQKKAVTVAAKSRQFTASETGKTSSSEETEEIWQKREL